MEELIIQAPAKINLHLQVVNKREDGFHNISSLFSLIDLSDTISFKENGNKIKLSESIPIADNIVLKAANLLKDKYSVKKGVRIELNKVIPDQKGLGGGSSNAAATLIALNKFWNLNCTQEEIMDLALTLGSDVPFFIFGKTAWAEGRGEILREFSYQERFFLLFLPKLRISTKSAFNEISLSDATRLTKENYEPDKYFNSFEKWVRSTYPIMDEIFLELQSIGNPRLSGTGSTIFIEYSNLKEAEIAKKKFPELVLTKSLERSPLMQIIE